LITMEISSLRRMKNSWRWLTEWNKTRCNWWVGSHIQKLTLTWKGTRSNCWESLTSPTFKVSF
jgi:hypothetical protein